MFKEIKRDKILRDKAFNIAKYPKYDGYQRGLASMVYKFFDEKSASLTDNSVSGSGIVNNNNNNSSSNNNNNNNNDLLATPTLLGSSWSKWKQYAYLYFINNKIIFSKNRYNKLCKFRNYLSRQKLDK